MFLYTYEEPRENGVRWLAIDLDGTLVEYCPTSGCDLVGTPIEAMVEQVKFWHTCGMLGIAIFTARLGHSYPDQYVSIFRANLIKWCREVLGFIPYLTSEKHRCFSLYLDDRAVYCPRDTGIPLWVSTQNLPPFLKRPVIFQSTPRGKITPEHEVLKETPKRAPELLREGADLFDQRNREYGNNYLEFGQFVAALFPHGITLKNEADFNRFGVLTQVIAKLTRYTNAMRQGTNGHLDSARDLKVYAAMLEELTHNEQVS